MDDDYFESVYQVDPPKEERKILIVCGTAKMANHYAHVNNWHNWKFVNSVEDLRGEANVSIAFAGTAIYRNDYNRLQEVADEMVAAGKAVVIDWKDMVF